MNKKIVDAAKHLDTAADIGGLLIEAKAMFDEDRIDKPRLDEIVKEIRKLNASPGFSQWARENGLDVDED